VSKNFHSGRRMAGSVTLALASVLMAAWVMSYLSSANLRLYGFSLESNSGTVEFEMSLSTSGVESRQLFWSVDYWVVTFPIAILSAGLILWPGKGTAAKPPDV